MNDALDWAMLLAGFVLGMLVTLCVNTIAWEKDAVARGFADYHIVECGRAKWRWNERQRPLETDQDEPPPAREGGK